MVDKRYTYPGVSLPTLSLNLMRGAGIVDGAVVPLPRVYHHPAQYQTRDPSSTFQLVGGAGAADGAAVPVPLLAAPRDDFRDGHTCGILEHSRSRT